MVWVACLSVGIPRDTVTIEEEEVEQEEGKDLSHFHLTLTTLEVSFSLSLVVSISLWESKEMKSARRVLNLNTRRELQG